MQPSRSGSFLLLLLYEKKKQVCGSGLLFSAGCYEELSFSPYCKNCFTYFSVVYQELFCMQIGKGAARSFDHYPPGNYTAAEPQGLLGAERMGCLVSGRSLRVSLIMSGCRVLCPVLLVVQVRPLGWTIYVSWSTRLQGLWLHCLSLTVATRFIDNMLLQNVLPLDLPCSICLPRAWCCRGWISRPRVSKACNAASELCRAGEDRGYWYFPGNGRALHGSCSHSLVQLHTKRGWASYYFFLIGVNSFLMWQQTPILLLGLNCVEQEYLLILMGWCVKGSKGS